jgi:flagellar biosynthesis protein FliP
MKSARRKSRGLISTTWVFTVALMMVSAGLGSEVPPSRSEDRGAALNSSGKSPDFGFGTGVFRVNQPLGDGSGVETGLRARDDSRKNQASKVPNSPQQLENRPAHSHSAPSESSQPVEVSNEPRRIAGTSLDPRDAMRTAQAVALFGLIPLAPVAVLMVTAFVRIEIVLVLLRQALGSPQVPGNQVLAALALLLTALVMRPVGENVYAKAILPYSSGQTSAVQAWEAGSKPIKAFMVDQIVQTNHQDYLWSLYHYACPFSLSKAEPVYSGEFPMRVVAPAYLLSELATALVMGFYIYLPFLVIDLVVSAVLAAMGLYMLPPTLVAMPVKLIVFVMADGWLLVASMLLSSFAIGGS